MIHRLVMEVNIETSVEHYKSYHFGIDWLLFRLAAVLQ